MKLKENESLRPDVVIIGSGLVGCMTAKHIRSKGLTTMIIDMKHPMAASKCCFGNFKEGWINESIKPEFGDGLALLNKYTGGIKEITLFNVKKEREDDFFIADFEKILDETVCIGEVVSIKNNIVSYITAGANMRAIAKKAVIVCAGAFTQEILENSGYDNAPKLDKLYGATIHVNMNIEENRITEWSPYKQSVLLKRGKGFVFGDGFTVKNPTVKDPRVKKGSERLQVHMNELVGITVPNDKIQEVREGYRPYLKKGTKNFVNQHDDRLFSATGGAKNTMILCGHMAKQVWEKIKNS